MIENKEIMAKNIKKYMAINRVNATDICKALDFKHNTFSDWVNAKTYPRIDAIEKMARYFGISKACLVEDMVNFDFYDAEHNLTIEVANDLARLTHDKVLLSYAVKLYKMDKAQKDVIYNMIDALNSTHVSSPSQNQE